MLGREVVVIIGWVGLGYEVLCGNGKTAMWLREGYGGTFVLVWRKIQLHQRNGRSTLA